MLAINLDMMKVLNVAIRRATLNSPKKLYCFNRLYQIHRQSAI